MVRRRAKRRRKAPGRKKTKRRMVRRRKKSTRRTTKRRLVGFTKTKGKFQLVFKTGKRLSLGKRKFSSKKALLSAAQKKLARR